MQHFPHDSAATVLLLATFHFANPGLDAVKHKTHNVMSEDSQLYLRQLAQRLAGFQPTTVLLEYNEIDDQKVNEQYSRYLNGEDSLSPSEIEQIGFRVARLAGLDRVNTFDERNTPWKSEELFRQLQQEPELAKGFHQVLAQMTRDEQKAHESMKLGDLLKRYNQAEMDRKNKGLYILTNAAGVGTNFSGADASASWWQRNFRMFARIQKQARPGARMLVVGGQGHIALLRDFADWDRNLCVEPVEPYLSI